MTHCISIVIYCNPNAIKQRVTSYFFQTAENISIIVRHNNGSDWLITCIFLSSFHSPQPYIGITCTIHEVLRNVRVL